jgi:hypothetical protein
MNAARSVATHHLTALRLYRDNLEGGGTVLGSILRKVFLTPRRPPSRLQVLRALAGSIVILAAVVAIFCYSPGQDHFGAITLDGDGKWYGNYVIKDLQILDTDVFFHGIGQSIDHASAADIVFLGTSRVVFGVNWRVFDEFAREHQLKMFNMAFAGVMSGNFSKVLIRKWHLKPRLWVIDVYADATNSFTNSFFNPDQYVGANEAQSMSRAGKIAAYINVGMIDFRWRLKMAFGVDGPASFRSDETGNWYVDRWPNDLRTDLPKMGRGKTACPADPREISAVRDLKNEIGGDVVLTQIPSIFSCRQRVQEIADAIGVPFFAPDPASYSTTDGGGHLDGISSARYTKEFFAWLEKTEPFQRIVDSPSQTAAIR